MLLTYARAFAVCAASVEFSRGQINGLMLMGAHDPISGESPIGQSTLTALGLLNDLCRGIPALNPVCDQIERVSQKLDQKILPILLHNELEQLQHRVFDELKRHYYYPVMEEYAATYANPAPFGEDVYNNFPSARIDIQNAGRCIIMSQGTAGVFHLMRVMEVALRVLGRDLGIGYAPSWESYILQITKLIGVKPHSSKPVSWRKKEPFYRDVLGDLTAIKTAWRNPTMHINNEYGLDAAIGIYQAVMTLMRRMAERGMREKGRPVAIAVALAGQPAL